MTTEAKSGKRSAGTASIGSRLKRLGYRSYSEYLASDHWKDLRLRFYRSGLVQRNQRGSVICQYCDFEGILHLHHRTYSRLGRERLNDLILLCPEHHRVAHEREKKSGMGLWGATKNARNSAGSDGKRPLSKGERRAVVIVRRIQKRLRSSLNPTMGKSSLPSGGRHGIRVTLRLHNGESVEFCRYYPSRGAAERGLVALENYYRPKGSDLVLTYSAATFWNNQYRKGKTT